MSKKTILDSFFQPKPSYQDFANALIDGDIETFKNYLNYYNAYEEKQADGALVSLDPILTIPRLMPLKFNTVWHNEYFVTETILSYGTMLPREIEVPKAALRITISPFTLDEEIVFVQIGLYEHDISKGVNVHTQIFHSDPDGLMCCLRSKTLIVREPGGQFIKSSGVEKLAAIENAGAVAGAKNILIIIKAKPFPESKPLVADTLQGLIEQGFEQLPESSDWESGQISYMMIKKCEKLSDELLNALC